MVKGGQREKRWSEVVENDQRRKMVRDNQEDKWWTKREEVVRGWSDLVEMVKDG